MLSLICVAWIVLIVGYVIANLAITEPEEWKNLKSEVNEAKRHFVSVRGNIF